MRILNISCDYPDPLVPSKTRAVSNLLAMDRADGRGHEHRVWSLNRIGWRAGIHALDFADAAGQGHRAVAYGAPPKGIGHRRYLDRLAGWMADDIARTGFAPDLIHAHKISVEGLVADRLAARLGVPLALSIQGDSDLKITATLRWLRRDYARIWQGAATAFPFAPWAAAGLDRLLGARTRPTVPLPCPLGAEARLAPAPAPAPVILSAFHLASAGRKNADGLIRAVGLAAGEVPDLRLDILGGGDAGAFARLSALAGQAAPGRVRFLGNVPNAEVQGHFNRATAFALVSHRETYGMVFAEALLAGTPCLIPQGQGIDGYFPDGEVTLAVPAGDVDAIARGLVRLVREEPAFKDRLARLGDTGGLAPLTRQGILAAYRGGLAALDTEGTAP